MSNKSAENSKLISGIIIGVISVIIGSAMGNTLAGIIVGVSQYFLLHMIKNRNYILTLFLLSVVFFSCQPNITDNKIENMAMTNDSISTNKSYHYQLAENISLESEIPIPTFDIDSIESYSYYQTGGIYSFIKDHDGRIFFSAIIAEISPAIFIEEIFPDYENAKVRYFIYNDMEIAEKNRNRIFAGTLLSQSEQRKVQDYINTFRNKGAISPQMWTPNSFDTSSVFRPIIDMNNQQYIITCNRERMDSIVVVEPLKRISFGRGK